MKESYISKGNRVTIVTEQVRKEWKPILHGLTANDTLNGLYSDTEKVTKVKSEFKTMSQIILREAGQTHEQRQDLSAAMQHIYDNKPELNAKVNKFHNGYKQMLDSLKSGHPKDSVIILSDDTVEVINDEMLKRSLGLIFKCKVIITRIEEEQFNGSKESGIYFVKTRTLASLYFNTLDELSSYIEEFIKPAFNASSESSIAQTENQVKLIVNAENESPTLVVTKISSEERKGVQQKELCTLESIDKLLSKYQMFKIGAKPNLDAIE